MMNKEDLAKKIEQTVKEVSFLRGLIITNSINIEGMIDGIIEVYFILPKRHTSFSEMALSDPFFSFGLKCNLLKKLLNKIKFVSYKDFKEDLHRTNNLRNRFAHSFMFGFEGDLIYHVREKPMEIKKAKEMYGEFMLLYPKVFGELERIFFYLVEESKKDKNSV